MENIYINYIKNFSQISISILFRHTLYFYMSLHNTFICKYEA
ncbi:hypothetical protein HMPREF3034_00434 [Prevotella sp. DNF00663]|nr:hypothetical protein HMPREF3034_00434 [Prevotella sp. DNF00663]